VDEHPAIAVQLCYADVGEAVSWLSRVFGFTESWTLAPQGTVVLAALRTPGDGSVMVSGLLSSCPPLDVNPYYSVTVMVPDVNAHFEQTRAAGARIVAEPTDQPWGYRDYEVLDHDGRQWNFSQVLHEVTPEDWGASGPSTSA
jgi:uncharacterized glyoxalase superfamily protein PhnB